MYITIPLCRYDYLDGGCYLLADNPELSWVEAIDFCTEKEGLLVVLNSTEERTALNTWLRNKGVYY